MFQIAKYQTSKQKKIKDWYKQEILTRELLHNILDIEKIVERKVINMVLIVR